MESLGRLKIHHHPPPHLSFTHTSSSSSLKQSSLLSIRPNPSFKYPSIKASKSQNFIITPPQKSAPSFRLFKSTCITLTTAATLLFLNLQLKPPAIAAPSESNKHHVTYEEEKERALEEHLATHPRDVDSLSSLVEVKSTSYKLPEAIKLIDRLIKLEPDEPKWPVQKARYFTCLGDTASATTVLEKVLAKHPLRAEAYYALVVAYSNAGLDWRKVERRIEEAMLSCKRENHQNYREFKHLVAQIRVIRGKHSEALKLYEELVEDEPSDFWPYFCQGAIYTLLKKEDKAEEQYLKFKKLVPENYNYMEDFLVNNLFAGELFSAMERGG